MVYHLFQLAPRRQMYRSRGQLFLLGFAERRKGQIDKDILSLFKLLHVLLNCVFLNIMGILWII